MCILHVKNCVLNKKIRFPYQFLIKNLVLLPPPELLFITQIPTHYFCSIANMKCDIFLLLLLLLVAVVVVFWHGMQNDSIHDLCDRELVYNLAYCAIIWSMWYKSETQSNAVFFRVQSNSPHRFETRRKWTETFVSFLLHQFSLVSHSPWINWNSYCFALLCFEFDCTTETYTFAFSLCG